MASKGLRDQSEPRNEMSVFPSGVDRDFLSDRLIAAFYLKGNFSISIRNIVEHPLQVVDKWIIGRLRELAYRRRQGLNWLWFNWALCRRWQARHPGLS